MGWDDVFKTLIIGIPSFLLGYLAYKRSKKVDKVTEQSGAITETRAGTQQVIEGLNSLLDNLQEDNTSFRADVRYLTDKLDTCYREREELKREVSRLKRKYGENDNTPPSNPITPKEK